MVLHYLRRVIPNAKTTPQIECVYENNVWVDANTHEPLVKGQIDRGHKAGYEDIVMRKCAEKCHMTQHDFNRMMQDPRLYQYETSKNNRSHRFESTDRLFQIHSCFEVIRNYKNRNRNRVGGRFTATPFTFSQDYLSNKSDSHHPEVNQVNNNHKQQKNPNIITNEQPGGTIMGTLAVILTEDVQNKLIQQYKAAIEKAVDIYVAKTSKLSEKSEKYQFDPFKDTVNDLITYFNMTLSLVIGTHFDEWRSGENSITKLLENIESDNDAAIQNAKMFEIRLYETEKEAIQSHRIAELNHPTTHPNFKIPELQEDMRTVQQACDEIETLKKETSAIFEEEAENNSVYSSVMSFIEMTLIELVGQFSGTKTAIDEKCIRAQQNTSKVATSGKDAYEGTKTRKSEAQRQIEEQARQKHRRHN